MANKKNSTLGTNSVGANQIKVSRSISEKDILKYFHENTIFLDTETRTSDVRKGDLAQIGISRPGQRGRVYQEVNILQEKGFDPLKDLQHFHQGERRLGPYYAGKIPGVPGIDVTRTSTWQKLVDEEGLTFSRAVMQKYQTQDWLNRSLNNNHFNISGHNIINFDTRKLNEFSDKELLNASPEFKRLIKNNALQRAELTRQLNVNQISPRQFRSAEIAQQMRVYELMVKEGLRGGALTDSMELAKSLFAIARHRGIISNKAAMALGSNVEFLGQNLLRTLIEAHRGVQDVSIQEQLQPLMMSYIEKLKTGKPGEVPKGLERWVEAWKNPEEIKVKATTRAIEQMIHNLSEAGTHILDSGRRVAHSFEEGRKILLELDEFERPFARTQGDRLTEYAKTPEELFDEAMKRISPHHKKLKGNIGFMPRVPKGLGGYMTAAAVAAGAGYLAYKTFLDKPQRKITGKDFTISGMDEDYLEIEGLRHGWYGESRKYITDFGSGYQGIREFNRRMKDPTFANAINSDFQNNERRRLEKKGSFKRSELMRVQDLETLEGINTARAQMREIKLAEYNIMVSDADTLILKKKGRPEDKAIVIRMGGIDAPEVSHGKAEGPLGKYNQMLANQPYGKKATERLQGIINKNENLRLLVDPSRKTYGRYVGVLYQGNENVNLKLVEEGYASSLEYGSANTAAVNRAAFMAAGDKAERQGLGMWGTDFFKDWKQFSRGAGRDITFTSFKDMLRLHRNKYLAEGAKLMWEDGYDPDASYRAGALYQATNQWSGKKDQYNTIQGLKHTWFGKQRKGTTDFGSGYQGPNQSPLPRAGAGAYEDPTPINWSYLATIGGIAGAARLAWNKKLPYDIDKLSYLGSDSKFLRRKKATIADIAYNAVRRFEFGLGGIPKAFSISTMMSPSIYKSAKYEAVLTGQKGFKASGAPKSAGSVLDAYPKGATLGERAYLQKLTGLSKKQMDQYYKVVMQDGQLFGITESGKRDVILKHAKLVKRVHEPLVAKAVSQFAKSYESIMMSAGIGPEKEFLITGGQTKRQALFRTAHAYAHETMAKYLRLMDASVEGLKGITPDISPKITGAVDKFAKFIPKFGVGGEKQLVGNLAQITGRHAMTALPKIAGIAAAYKVADWAVRGFAPDDSVGGKAGLLGLGAEAVRMAHMTYATVSEATGLTALRKKAEEYAPGAPGIATTVGLTFGSFMAGTAAGMAANALEEVFAPRGSETYAKMVHAKSAKEGFTGALSGLKKLPGFKGEYLRSIRWGKVAGLVGLATSVPFLIPGLGSEKTVDELNQEYLEGKEVAIRKARWWEFGKTPWEGDKVMYYRPNWYNRLLSDYYNESLYDGYINPLEKAYKDFTDPHWLAKKHYRDRPYPVSGPDFSGTGMFQPVLEATLGRGLMPTVYMHTDEWMGEDSGGYGGPGSGIRDNVSHELGGMAKEQPMSPYSFKEALKEQYYRTYEAAGLRGFVTSAIKEAVTGEQDVFEHTPILQSAADMTSAQRRFWDLNIGGGLTMSEGPRRFIPKRPYTSEYVNPIKNTMPGWMPGQDHYIDFTTGDPYTKVQEGEYRLPGAGYAARFKELQGLNPEDYPLIHRYKILADVAPYSKEFRRTRRQLQKFEPTEHELNIFLETEEQLEERRKKKRFREEVYKENAYGRYAAAVFDIAKANPLEELTPIAPAHKFLPQTSALNQYEESIYGKEFKLWQRPMEDFIKPALNSMGNLIGIDSIPSQIQEARQIESYFDKLKYVKYKRLEKQARARGADKRARYYMNEWSRTRAGMDVYANEHRLISGLPKREKAFYEEFKNSSPDQRARILELLPPDLRDFYIAQWDKQILERMQLEGFQTSEEEKWMAEREVFNRMATIRAKRQARTQAIVEDDKLPDDDWIGWRADVDLEDVKLKYLLQEGRDYHYYDLWDDRVRNLRRKPYLEEVVESIDPLAGLGNIPLTYQEVYQHAVDSGIRNPEIISRTGGGGVSYDLEYDREIEIRENMRELGAIS